MAQFAVVAAASAQSAIEPYVEYAKLVRATEQTAPLDDDLMGDSVSLFDGQTSFRNVDIQLKGNDALPVELARRLAVKPRPLGDFSKEYAGLGNWEIDVPSISGTFDAAYKWNTDVLNRPKARCSAVFYPTVRSGVNRREVWHGNSVHVPGRGDQEMLLLDGSPLAPTNGRAHLWTTSAMDAFECKGSTANGYPGEGFVMTTAAGTKYTFDVAVERGGSVIEKNQVRVPRTTVYLLASRIEDRLGNHVTYRYNGNGHPVSIASSDGRSISLDYDGERLVRASANGRVWSYHYDGNGQLATVVRPDQSRWQYQYGGSRVIVYEAWDAAIPPSCGGPEVASGQYSITVTHPSSAVGTFSFDHLRHYRSGVRLSNCQPRPAGPGETINHQLLLANFHEVFSLGTKTISGPGLPPAMTWKYGYEQKPYPLWGTSQPMAGLCPADTCPRSKTVSVLQPGGHYQTYEFGVLWGLNEGRLLAVRTVAADGTSVVREERNDFLQEEEVAGHAFPAKYGILPGGDEPSAAHVRPMIRKTMTQDGTSFVWQVATGCGSGRYCLDGLARPLRVERASSLGYSKTEDTAYFDQTNTWVLGKTASVAQTAPRSVPMYSASYGPTALPSEESVFGALKHKLQWNPDGTLAAFTDAKGATTALSGWKRGVPQRIQHPATADQLAGTAETATVDDNGWIRSSTDVNGTTSTFDYDTMGRMTLRTHAEGDTVSWNATTQALEQVPAQEYGIGAGHWRQTTSTGNHRKVAYLDAMWRPLLVLEYDASDQAGTQRFERFGYDAEGRTVFMSYPSSDSAAAAGTWTEHDALDRPTSVSQDSEWGLLVTRTAYLNGFKREITDPKGRKQRHWFQAYDTPTYDWPVRIDQPEGVSTSLLRDAFGKPETIHRGGPAG
ncbi:wall associated protein [Xanthomonas theicola]|uniref:Wall associated protein n=2 Tax=Xanthomonas theicola TaxID=56464 RepID=A0A2S6ZD99_9XANT|nr:wall associated protein [Xanthomonas theicola]QNH27187.1 RHS repeat protein [Xanthomonas theicola]